VRRVFWLSLGATAGVLVVRRLTRTAQAYTPEGMATSLSALAGAVHDFADAVREGMAQREEELRVALGVDAGAIPPDSAQALIDSPAGSHAPLAAEQELRGR
jgi:hypothetical protein